MALLTVVENKSMPVFEEGHTLDVVVQMAKQQDSRLRVDRNDPDSEPLKEINFLFIPIAAEFADLESNGLWGNALVKTFHPDGKLYEWVSAMLGTELQEGVSLDTDDLVGREVTVSLRKYEKNAGGYANAVQDVFPRSASPRGTAVLDGPSNAPVGGYNYDEEPF